MSATGPATHEDFARWEHLARSLHISALTHTMRDCYTAARAMQGHNPEREGYYLDQAMTFERELIRRRGRAEEHTGKTIKLAPGSVHVGETEY